MRTAEKLRPVHEIGHPLPPELLVAEFAGELPPDVAHIVREHIAGCESCGARARALAAPYDLIASLGDEPVPYVPDLRRPVRVRLERERFLAVLVRAAGVVGRGGLGGIAALCGLALLVALVVATSAIQAPVAVERSANGVAAAPAGASGVLYAATAKVLDVHDASGRVWPAAEVVAVDERTGRVLQSVPSGGAHLRIGKSSELPVAVALSPDGRTLYQLTNAAAGAQALLALDAHTGQLLFATPLTLPDGGGLPSGVQALSLAVSRDGQHVYVGLSLGPAGLDGPRALALGDAGVTVLAALTPTLDAVVPEPPTSASLPGVPTPPQVPLFVTDGLHPALAAGGAIALSPDGFWLFDAITLADAQGQLAVVVRRISVVDGTTAQSLAFTGDFSLAALGASPNPYQSLLYLARGGPDGQLYVLRALPAGPTLVGQVPLGGPAAPAGTVFSGQMTLSPSVDGGRVYVSGDVTADGNQYGSHDLWLVDANSASLISHRIGAVEAGQALANWAGGGQGRVFVLLGGQVALLPADLALTSAAPVWLRLKDGTPILRLVGTAA